MIFFSKNGIVYNKYIVKFLFKEEIIMKKIFTVIVSCFMVFALVACGGSGTSGMADGVYTAKVDESFAQNFGYGWTDQLTVTYKDGKMVSAVFDSLNADGLSKKDDSTYPMEPAPSTWFPELSKNIENATNAQDIVAVAGASMSSENAKYLLEGIEKEGKPGETITVTIPVTAD